MKPQFLKLYDRNVDGIYRYCLRKTHNKEIAKSLTEETFKRMWDYMSPNQSVMEIESTLFSIASRVIRRHLEKKAPVPTYTTFQFS